MLGLIFHNTKRRLLQVLLVVLSRTLCLCKRVGSLVTALLEASLSQTLLHWAAIYGNHIDVEWLLSSGAQLLALDQLVFQDLRLTILKPKKQELGEACVLFDEKT